MTAGDVQAAGDLDLAETLLVEDVQVLERNPVVVIAGDVQAAGDPNLAETLLVVTDAEVAHDELEADAGEDIATPS